jgi:hypothetical protein
MTMFSFVSYSFWGFTIGFFRTPWATVQTHVILGNAVNVKDNFRDLGPISSPCTERPTTHIGTTSRIILEISSAPWQILEKSYPRKIPWKEFKPSGEIQNIFKISSLFPSIPETSSQNPGNREDLFFLNLWTHDRTITAKKTCFYWNHKRLRQKHCFSPDVLIKCPVNHRKIFIASSKNKICSWNHHEITMLSSKQTYCWTRDIIIIIIVIIIVIVIVIVIIVSLWKIVVFC